MKKNVLVEKYKKYYFAGIMGWIVGTVGELADSFIAGANLGSDAVAATSIVAPVYYIFCVLGVIFTTGGVIRFSNEKGAGNNRKANEIFTQTLLITTAGGILFCVLMLVFMKPFLNFFAPSDAVYQYCVDYYIPHIAMAAIYPIYLCLYSFECADGSNIYAVVIDTTYAIVNLGLSLVLVKSMGVKGLGYGSLVAVIVMLVQLLIRFTFKSNSLKIAFKFDMDILRWTFVHSLSSCMAYTLSAVLDIVLNKYIIKNFGDTYLAVYQVVNLAVAVSAITMASSDSIAGIISMENGEENAIESGLIMKEAKKRTLIVGAAMTLGMAALSFYIPELYGLTDEPYRHLAVTSGLMLSVTLIPAAFLFLITKYYEGLFDVIIALVGNIAYLFAYPLVLSILFSKMWGYMGITIGFVVAYFLSLATVLVLIIVKYGKENVVFKKLKFDEKQYLFNLYIDSNQIMSVRDEVDNVLAENNIGSDIRNKVMLTIEESLHIIMEKNKHKVLCECFLGIKDDRIRLITKDDGLIMSINDDDVVDSFRRYIFNTCKTMNASNTSNMVLAMNINSYEF